MPLTTPVFGTATKRHEEDNITISQPFIEEIIFGKDHLAKITRTYLPKLKNGTTPRNSGVVIPNITDGFSGVAPDRGAVISGRREIVIGDAVPSPPKNLRFLEE